VVTGEEPFAITQTRQIVHLDDLCNECGNCATFCVHQGTPYLDKPRLYLNRANFEQETDNAFHIQGSTICARPGGREISLTATENSLIFENEQIRVRLSPEFEPLDMEAKQCFESACSLRLAAEMALLLTGVTASLPFLLTARPQP
jgi:putative selenate reductase